MRNAKSTPAVSAYAIEECLDREHTTSFLVRERKRQRDKEGERERERCRICPELLFFKGMTGTLAPFSYLVYYNSERRSTVLFLPVQ